MSMRPLAALVLALAAAACTPPPTTPVPARAPTPHPEAKASPDAVQRHDPPVKFDVAAPAHGCVDTCMSQRRMQAHSVEAIEASCRRHCGEPAPDVAADDACKAAVAKARKVVESVPMPKRAPKVFAALVDPAVSCGSTDPALADLARAGAKADREAREAALAEVLRTDPDFSGLCPAGPSVLDDVAAESSRQRVHWIIATCPIDDAHEGAGSYGDVGPMTYLASRLLQRIWALQGATTSDHRIMIDIVLLASGLEAEAARGR